MTQPTPDDLRRWAVDADAEEEHYAERARIQRTQGNNGGADANEIEAGDWHRHAAYLRAQAERPQVYLREPLVAGGTVGVRFDASESEARAGGEASPSRKEADPGTDDSKTAGLRPTTPSEDATGLMIVCGDCGTLVGGVEAGNRVRWVTCSVCRLREGRAVPSPPAPTQQHGGQVTNCPRCGAASSTSRYCACGFDYILQRSTPGVVWPTAHGVDVETEVAAPPAEAPGRIIESTDGLGGKHYERVVGTTETGLIVEPAEAPAREQCGGCCPTCGGSGHVVDTRDLEDSAVPVAPSSKADEHQPKVAGIVESPAPLSREALGRAEGLTFDMLRQQNVARCVEDFKHSLESWSVAEWTNAMCGEAGEAANVAKKMLRHRDAVPGNTGADTDLEALRAKLAAELADVVIYTDLVAASQGVDLGAAIIATWDAKSAQIGSTRRLADALARPTPEEPT
jgi:NTP pyrophosphatase (non-canonical NTP hydrolase)